MVDVKSRNIPPLPLILLQSMYILLLDFCLSNIFIFSDIFAIVPVKMDMRAEYCPSALMVDGCPVELSRGALEYFDENATRYVSRYLFF